MSWRAVARLAVACALAWLGPAVPAIARVPIGSTSGSGAFGRWAVDGAGLPMYRYTLDQARAPFARQPELARPHRRLAPDRQRARDRGRLERRPRPALEPGPPLRVGQPLRPRRAAAGGRLRLAAVGRRRRSARATPTAPPARAPPREFGMGYVRRTIAAAGFRVDERVHAPLGAGPVLVHEVTIVNTTRRAAVGLLVRVLGRQPLRPGRQAQIGLDRPRAGAGGRLLTVAQRPSAADRRPLTIFAAALDGPVAGRATRRRAVLRRRRRAPARRGRRGPAGPGGRAGGRARRPRPDDARPSSAPGGCGPAGGSRCATPTASPMRSRSAALVAARRADRRAFDRSRRAWARWVPQIRLGGGRAWLSRELQWSAYMLRSGRLLRGVPRAADPLPGRLLPVRPRLPGRVPRPAAARPAADLRRRRAIARDVLLYSASEQPRAAGRCPTR